MPSISLEELQSYIKSRDHNPELAPGYFMKLIEEVGELSEMIRKDKKYRGDQDKKEVKGTVAEELYDVLYYTCALANIFEVDLSEIHEIKKQLNIEKYGS